MKYVNAVVCSLAMKTTILAVGVLFFALPLAADFPPISDAERGFEGRPGTPAIVLFKKAELKLMDYPREISSYLKVDVRLKILSEEGKSYGEVEIPHSGYYRLKDIEGRTVLPGGREVALPKDAVFEERRSRSAKAFVTKLVFPAVEVGAILDYRYSIRWDDMVFLEPWYFHSEVPTLFSEITYIKPDNMALQPWGVQAPGSQVQSEAQNTAKGKATRLWAQNLPGIPEEPFMLSFNDLSSRFMMVPIAIHVNGIRQQLLDSWEGAWELFEPAYSAVRKKDRQARKHAASLAAGQASLLDKIAAVHAFARDDVRTVLAIGVGIGDDQKVDKVLEDRSGSPVAKALLLQSMLEGIKVKSDLVWVADRTAGRPDLRVANPWWFDAVLVRVEVDGGSFFLDPVDRSVGFGRLAPYYEGTEGLLMHKKPQIVELPAAPFDNNQRRVQVDLELDDEGRVHGGGSQVLEGHQAWRYLRWKDDAAATAGAWEEHLEDRFDGFDVSEVEVEEDVRRQHVRVDWTMRQRDEEVLGDEAAIVPAQPLATHQPFSLPPERRQTPVQMSFGWRDDLVTTVTWPEGWVIDARPEAQSHGGPAGKIERTVETDEAQRTITVRRRFELAEREFFGREAYGMLRELFEQASNGDAQGVVPCPRLGPCGVSSRWPPCWPPRRRPTPRRCSRRPSPSTSAPAARCASAPT